MDYGSLDGKEEEGWMDGRIINVEQVALRKKNGFSLFWIGFVGGLVSISLKVLRCRGRRS